MYNQVNFCKNYNIKAIVTNRHHGVSVNEFNSLNLADHVNDNIKSVKQNRLLITKQAKLPQEPLWLKQVHSNNVISADDYHPETAADGIVTHKHSLVLTILTADCLPILFFQPDTNAIGACHAGWQGLAKNIIKNTIDKLNGKPSNIYCWIGPGISKKNYQTNQEIANQVLSTINLKTHHNNPHINLKNIAKLQLLQLGVKNILIDHRCSFDDFNLFSYRRQNITGRFASCIWINSPA